MFVCSVQESPLRQIEGRRDVLNAIVFTDGDWLDLWICRDHLKQTLICRLAYGDDLSTDAPKREGSWKRSSHSLFKCDW